MRIGWRPLALVIGFATLPMLRYFGDPFETQDEAILVVFGEQVMSGHVPNRDFFTVYGPGNYWLLAGLFHLTGPSILAERAVALLYHVGVATGVLAVTRCWGAVPACAAAVAAAALLIPLGLTAYAWLGAVALVLWAIGMLDVEGQPALTVCAGALAASAIAWRYEMAVVAAAASVPLIWRDPRARPFLLGVACGSVPTLAHVLLAGRSVFDNVVVGRLAINAQLDLGANLPGVIAGLTACCVSVALVVLVAVRERTRIAVALAALCVLLLPQSFQRVDYIHLLFTLTVSGPVVVAQQLGRSHLGPRLHGHLERRSLSRVAASVPLVLLALLTYSSVTALVDRAGWQVVHRGRSMPVATEHEREVLQATVSSVTRHVPPGRVLFVGAQDMSVPTLNDVRLYYLLPEYRASAYYLDLPAGVAERRDSGLSRDVLTADALVLVDIPAAVSSGLFPHMQAGAQQANAAVSERFCLADRTEHADVYVRCRR